MEKDGWVKRTKEGIIRHDFSKKDFLNSNNDYTKKWSVDTRKIIAEKHKPLFKITKNGGFYQRKFYTIPGTSDHKD